MQPPSVVKPFQVLEDGAPGGFPGREAPMMDENFGRVLSRATGSGPHLASARGIPDTTPSRVKVAAPKSAVFVL